MEKVNKTSLTTLIISGLIFIWSFLERNHPIGNDFNPFVFFGGLLTNSFFTILMFLSFLVMIASVITINSKNNQMPENYSNKYLITKKILFILFIIMLLFFAYNFYRFI